MKFISLIKNDGSVTYGDNGSSKIIGKGTLSLENGVAKVENVLCVKDLKHNLLSVSQMCDQGHTLTFDSHECEIRRSMSGKLVGITVRTPNNVYILAKIRGETCLIEQTNEIWLWHKRMGHRNFENIVKINKNQDVKLMPKITTPSSTICKYCQHKNKTHVSFKSKEFTSSKPLELIHTNLCGPTRSQSFQ